MAIDKIHILIIKQIKSARVYLLSIWLKMKEQIIELYKKYVLTHNQRPDNVFQFVEFGAITEADFYAHFAGLNAVEEEFYSGWFTQAFEQCTSSEPWMNYSVREKLLAIHYTFIEVLKPHRTLITWLADQDVKQLPKWPSYLNKLHGTFKILVQPVIDEGLDTRELAQRKFIDEQYIQAVWINLLFVLKFWINDRSSGFEKTDEAIEKSVNMNVDLLSKSAWDSAVDFGKFLFQQSPFMSKK